MRRKKHHQPAQHHGAIACIAPRHQASPSIPGRGSLGARWSAEAPFISPSPPKRRRTRSPSSGQRLDGRALGLVSGTTGMATGHDALLTSAGSTRAPVQTRTPAGRPRTRQASGMCASMGNGGSPSAPGGMARVRNAGLGPRPPCLRRRAAVAGRQGFQTLPALAGRGRLPKPPRALAGLPQSRHERGPFGTHLGPSPQQHCMIQVDLRPVSHGLTQAPPIHRHLYAGPAPKGTSDQAGQWRPPAHCHSRNPLAVRGVHEYGRAVSQLACGRRPAWTAPRATAGVRCGGIACSPGVPRPRPAPPIGPRPRDRHVLNGVWWPP